MRSRLLEAIVGVILLMSCATNIVSAGFQIENQPIGSFAAWATAGGVEITQGDFNGDGRLDVALVRRDCGWATLPVAFTNEDGSYEISNANVGSFAHWAAHSGAKVLTGDFNSDGLSDIALVRQDSGWGSIPIAFSNGDGTFRITNQGVESFPAWATNAGVKVLTGDFNGDERTDVALIRQEGGWGTVPIAFSNGDGTFNVTNGNVGSFAGWAATPGVKVVTGDFNGDARIDVALVRQEDGWGTIPIAFSNGDGTFSIVNGSAGSFAGWAATSGVKVLTGDFNGDARTDVALIRQESGWSTVPIAFSNGDGTFNITNGSVGSFAGWAATSGVKVLTDDFNGDGQADIGLIRQAAGWGSLPVALSVSEGVFQITNSPVGAFAGWAATSGVQVIGGDFSRDGRADVGLVRLTSGWGTLPTALSNSAKVVNMIPRVVSGETNQDSEPFLAVNPTDTQLLAASAFTPNPAGATPGTAPIFTSYNGGQAWNLENAVTSQTMTGDITHAFPKNNSGSFAIVNSGIGNFATWATTSGVQVLDGDFNGDDLTDVALVRQESGWATLPLAITNEDGSYNITNANVGSFASWAATSGVKLLKGDFNGDNRTDVALIRQESGWGTVPVAFSNGDGTFNITNGNVGPFAGWAATNGVTVLTGDFNSDDRTDVALIRQESGWDTVPIAFSNGDGTFNITNGNVGSFAGWAATNGVKVLTGDYNGDDRTDVALIRQEDGWGTVPIAFSAGDGSFSVTNGYVGSFAGWATVSGVKVLTGDFNSDSHTDVALIRQESGWGTVPVAFSNGDGSFTVTNGNAGPFAGWAATSGVRVVTGEFNGDGRTDLALVRQTPGWATVPIAFSDGLGGYRIDNRGVGNFADWAATSGAQILSGDFTGDSRTDLALLRRTSGWNTLPTASPLESLYAGILRRPGSLLLNELVTRNIDSPAAMTVQSSRSRVDQPFVQASTGGGSDRVYVGNNDFNAASGRTATVDVSLNGGQTYNSIRIEPRSTGTAGQDGPSVRPSVAHDGTVYVAYFGWRAFNNSTSTATSDIVVVRDDNGATGANPFRDLMGTDGSFGRRVVQSRSIPWQNTGALGQERIGSTLSIAVDPNESDIVYVAWADRVGTGDIYTVHVRRSTDRGVTWSGDLRTVTDATCIAISVAENGTVGFLYHQLTGTGVNQRWVARFEQTRDAFANRRDTILSTVPAKTPVAQFLPYLGDYNFVLATGNEFRGVFSANNAPDVDNFPEGIRYQRHADFDSHTLNDGSGNNVAISIDPFYFAVPAIRQ